MKIEVEKEDIRKIGNSYSNEDGFLAIACDDDMADIEEIMLRSILKCFGKEYHIVCSRDVIWQDDDESGFNIQFITNLPIEMYEKIVNS